MRTKILDKTLRNAQPSLKYTLFLCIHLKTSFHLYSAQLLSVSDPHQEICHWIQASMQSSILGWQNLSILLCIFVHQFKLSSIRLHTGRTGALEMSNISLYQAIV